MSANIYEQPGLEVAGGQDWPRVREDYGLQPVHPPPEKYSTIEYVQPEPSHELYATKDQNTSEPSRRRRRWFIIGGIILVLVVAAAAVIGGVVGSRHSSTIQGNQSTSSTNSTDSASNSTSIVSLKSIQQGSSMAVTGWRKSNGVEIYLYYQSPENAIRVSEYDSGRGSFTTNNSYWEDSQAVVLAVASALTANTSLGAGMLLWGTKYEPELQIFYVDSSNALLGANFDADNDVGSAYPQDSISDFDLEAASGSGMAAYWPYLAYIDSSNVITIAKNKGDSSNNLSPSSIWNTTTTDLQVLPGSTLALVPLAVSYNEIATGENIGVFYQDADGMLTGYSFASGNEALVQSWPTDAVFPTIQLPGGASFAAFTTSRANDNEGRVNTYVLYQEESSRISMAYLTDDAGWKTVQPESLTNADNGTSIACLTMSTSPYDANLQALDLEQASSESKCYFQRGGLVREVVLSGTDWVEVGIVPME